MDRKSRTRVSTLTRRQSLAQLAIAWTLRRPTVTSSLIGASKVSQIEEIVAGLAEVV